MGFNLEGNSPFTQGDFSVLFEMTIVGQIPRDFPGIEWTGKQSPYGQKTIPDNETTLVQ
jgi:hypothetical protein